MRIYNSSTEKVERSKVGKSATFFKSGTVKSGQSATFFKSGTVKVGKVRHFKRFFWRSNAGLDATTENGERYYRERGTLLPRTGNASTT